MPTTIRKALGLLVAGVLLGIGFSVTTAIADSFTDVPPSNFFAEDIDWLTDYDIANGFPDGTFDPNGPIKRQQAALWMRNLAGEFENVTTSTNPGPAEVFNLTVDCPADKRVLAGGGSTSQSTLFITDSRAIDANSWAVRWEVHDDVLVDPTNVTVQALCGPRL